ncbi:GTPase [Deltaproteobacteria bacterium TL4]
MSLLNLNKLSNKWILALGMLCIPVIFLMVAGFFWLYEQSVLSGWFILSALIAAVVLPYIKTLQSNRISQLSTEVIPDKTWTETGARAWREVQRLSAKVKNEEVHLESLENMWKLLKVIMERVAQVFHPKSDNSIMEVPIPYLLKVVELVAIDLRDAFSRNLPGSHILTINDILLGKRLAALGKELYDLYRVLSFGINPPSALAREFRDFITGKVMNTSSHELKAWLIQSYVEKIGYYAVELYSGRLVLDEVDFQRVTKQTTETKIQKAQKRDEFIKEEPLHMLILGQVNSGKSSLINALFGEMKALVDVVPQTTGIEAYLLEREGLERALVFDTAGYQSAETPFEPLALAEKELLHTDLIIITCAANSAARNADFQMIEGLKGFYKKHQRPAPPLLVALTHIDALRPLKEWQPPYNVASPERPKEKMIRNAMEAVASDLKLKITQIIPISLRPKQEYNINEGLISSILSVFDETQRLKYLRCLTSYKDNRYWKNLWEQNVNVGKLVIQGSLHVASKLGEKLDELTQRINDNRELKKKDEES